MTLFDLSPEALVNAGGAAIFVLLGIAILAVGRAQRRGVILGALAITFGMAYVFQNVLPGVGPDGAAIEGPALPLFLAAAVPAILLAVLLAWHLAAGLPGRIQGFVGAAAALFTVIGVVLIVYIETSPAQYGLPATLDGRLNFYPNMFMAPAVLVLVAVLGARARRASHEREARAMAGLALAFGPWAAFSWMTIFATALHWDALPQTVIIVGAALGGACMLTWAPFGRPLERRFARLSYLLLVAAAVLGLVLSPSYLQHITQFGLFGVFRTIGAVFLVLAVVKYDLLGVPLPHVVVKRGVVAGAALAILFIVAQITQNFLSAQYGLLGGGVIAGTFLFAASPVQRAIENRQSKTAASPAHEAGNDDSFREAVELAFKDRRFTPQEEMALARLATRLGVSAERATEIRHAVERGAR